MSGPYQQKSLKTLLLMAPIEGAFGSEANFREALKLLGEECPTENLRACINMLQAKNGGKGSGSFEGLGGIPTHAMLDIADDSLKGNGRFNGRPKDFGVTGQIMPTCLDSSAGYSYVDEKLDLCVRMIVSKNRGGKKIAIEMKVSASSAKYETKKDMPSDLLNVFPKAAQATKIKVNWGTAAGFKSKLYAIGENVTVEKVWVNKKFENKPNDFELVPMTGNKLKKYQALYDTDAESCIDMMFAADVPPAALASTDAPPFYCLGRCGSPPIINTH